MTVRELHEWATENDALDLDIEIQYRDGGGYYFGVDECDPTLSERQKEYHTENVVLL